MYSNANTSSLICFYFFFIFLLFLPSFLNSSITRSLLGFFNYNFTVFLLIIIVNFFCYVVIFFYFLVLFLFVAFRGIAQTA